MSVFIARVPYLKQNLSRVAVGGFLYLLYDPHQFLYLFILHFVLHAGLLQGCLALANPVQMILLQDLHFCNHFSVILLQLLVLLFPHVHFFLQLFLLVPEISVSPLYLPILPLHLLLFLKDTILVGSLSILKVIEIESDIRMGVCRRVELRDGMVEDVWLPFKYAEEGFSANFFLVAQEEDDLDLQGGFFGIKVQLFGDVDGGDAVEYLTAGAERQGFFFLLDEDICFALAESYLELMQLQYNFEH